MSWLTELEKCIGVVDKYFVTIINVVVLVLSHFLVSAFVICVSPSMWEFYQELGRVDTPVVARIYYFLIGFSYTFIFINTGALVWHFQIKKQKVSIFRSKFFFCWLALGNLTLLAVFFKFIGAPLN